MPKMNETLIVVKQWIQKAENDLKTAAYTLRMGKDCPTDTVCFHAQQCVEKCLKALLILKNIGFPKTHDVGELAILLPEEHRPKLTLEEQERLTDYATIARYPGDYEIIPLPEAQQAVTVANRVYST